MKMIKSMLFGAALAFFGVSAALAQVPSVTGPFNTDIGAVITNALRTAGTVTTNQLTNSNSRGVVCTFVATASSGSPSTTFSIQGYDAANAVYQTIATSGAITDGTTTSLGVYPGMSATPATAYTAVSAHLPLHWRVSQTVGGSAGPAITGKIGCNLLN